MHRVLPPSVGAPSKPVASPPLDAVMCLHPVFQCPVLDDMTTKPPLTVSYGPPGSIVTVYGQ